MIQAVIEDVSACFYLEKNAKKSQLKLQLQLEAFP